MAWYWWLLVGILMGWLLSTLIEWLWFRRKRMEVQDERIAELESALRASEDDGPASSRGSSAAPTGAAATAVGIPATLADREVTLEAPDLDAPVTMPDVSTEMSGLAVSIDTAVDMPDIDMPDVDMPDVDLPDMSAEMSGLAASIDAVDMPDVDMPNVDMPDAGPPDMSAQISGLNASINTAENMSDIDMPDVDLPDVDLPEVSA